VTINHNHDYVDSVDNGEKKENKSNRQTINKKEIESIDQEIKLQRKQVMDIKKCIRDYNNEKDNLIKETHGLG